MKEVHDEQGCDGCESEKKSHCVINHVHVEDAYSIHTDFVKCKDIQECVKTWHIVATLTKIAEDVFSGRESDGAPINKDEARECIKRTAVINLKKIGGGASANSEASTDGVDYRSHGEKFQNYINAQIFDINPTIIFCGGTMSEAADSDEVNLFGFICKKVEGIELCKAVYGVYLTEKNVPVVSMRHPSVGVGYNEFAQCIKRIRERFVSP